MEDLTASVVTRVLRTVGSAASFVVDMLGVRDWIKSVRRDKREKAGPVTTPPDIQS